MAEMQQRGGEFAMVPASSPLSAVGSVLLADGGGRTGGRKRGSITRGGGEGVGGVGGVDGGESVGGRTRAGGSAREL